MDKLKMILPSYVVNAISKLNNFEISNLTEIRLRVNKPAYMFIAGIEYGINENGISKFDGIIFTCDEAKEMWRRLCEGAPYSTTIQQKAGFITIDGNRIGFCGEYAFQEDNIKHINIITSFCVRIKHEVKGCANKVFRYLFDNDEFKNTLVISPPGCGKTTLLRDITRLLSSEGFNICVADERNEITAANKGIPMHDVGKRTDVFSNVKKSIAIDNMIRSLRPDVIVVDELGGQDDIISITNASKKGVKIVASIHGKNIDDIESLKNIFNRVVVLSKKAGVGTVENVYDSSFKSVIKNIC